MAALDPAVTAEPDPNQHVTAKALNQRHPLSSLPRILHLGPHCAIGQLLEDLFQERKALLDFADPDPEAGIDVPRLQNRYIELQAVVGRIPST